jgi:hypothetical protein
MALNVAGVSGMLSNAYEARRLAGEAQQAQATTVTAAEVADILSARSSRRLTVNLPKPAPPGIARAVVG